LIIEATRDEINRLGLIEYLKIPKTHPRKKCFYAHITRLMARLSKSIKLDDSFLLQLPINLSLATKKCLKPDSLSSLTKL